MNASRAPGKLPEDLERALAELQKGERAQAARLAEAHLQHQPEDGAAWYLLGTIALQENRFASARDCFHRALRNTPRSAALAMCWNGLGHALAGLADSGHALEAFRRAALADASAPQHALDYAAALIDARQRLLALEILDRVMRQGCPTPELCVRLGNLLVQCERFEAGLGAFEHALALDAGYAPAYFNSSVALAILGKTQQALGVCERALVLDPSLAGYYQLAGLGGLHGNAERIAFLEARAADAGASQVAQIDAGFALARVYDHAASYDKAFGYLARANALKRASFTFNLATETERIERIMAFFSAQFLARFSGKLQSELRPIFILGMPRAGSTLLEQMLAAHPSVTAGGELDCMTDVARALGSIWEARAARMPGTDAEILADLHQAAGDYRRAVLGRLPHAGYFTDKMPSNFLFVGLIHLMLPAARIIHIRRDPLDTCLSCYQHLFTSYIPYAYDLQELGGYYRLYRKLMRHWQAVLPAGRVLNMDYETLIENPQGEIRKALDYCGLPFDARCLEPEAVQRPVNTASANQVRKPIYHSSVGRSRHYATHLKPLRDALGA